MDFEKDIVACLKVLAGGGLILYPTDTIWGIGCDATRPDAVEKVYALKQRAENKAMIILVADEREILKWVAQPDLRVFDYLKSQSRPTTVIYEGGMGLADNLVAPDRTIAIRIVKDDFCRHLIKRFRKPLVSTSANISGEAAPAFFDDITDTIKRGVNYTVHWRRDDKAVRPPSSVIRWNSRGQPEILRP